MEILTEMFGKLGLDLQLMLTLCGAVLLIVNAIKVKVPVITGYWTQILTIFVSFGLSFAVYSQGQGEMNWLAVGITTFVCWLGPDSFISLVNRKIKKITG